MTASATVTYLPLTPTDAAWLAGIVEGEGTIDFRGRSPRVRVRMRDADVIYRVATLFGGVPVGTEIDPRSNLDGTPRSPMFRAAAHGDDAVRVLLAILPYLGSRRTARASEVLSARYADGARVSFLGERALGAGASRGATANLVLVDETRRGEAA